MNPCSLGVCQILHRIFVIPLATFFPAFAFRAAVFRSSISGAAFSSQMLMFRSLLACDKMVKTCIEQSAVKLNSHQILTAETILDQRGLLVVHATGSGKTLTAVTAADCVLEEYPKSKVVVVTPKSLADNFRKEMTKYGMPDDLMKRVKVMTTTEFVRSYKKGSCKNTMLIVDEAHNLRTEKGSQAQALIDCAKSAFKVLLLTATPVVNEPYDIANLMAMIYGKNPPTRAEFKGILSDPVEFKKFFRCKISYFTPSDMSNYPTVESNEVKLLMDKAYYDAYMKTEERYLGIWRKEGDQKEGGEAFFSALRQAVNQMSSPQLSKVDWILNKAAEGERTLIYSEFVRSTLRPLMVLLEEDGILYEHITGDMSREARTAAVNAYNGGSVNVLVVSSAGGEGLDLKGTRNVIITEPAWNESKIQQITGRAVRYNSHSHITDPKDRLVSVYKLYVTKPPHEVKLAFGREKEIELLSPPSFTKHDYNLYIAGLKASIADSEERYADIDDPDEGDIEHFEAVIAADKKAAKETYKAWDARITAAAVAQYSRYMQYVPIIKGFCPGSTSQYIIDDLDCYLGAANAITDADDSQINKVRQVLEDNIRAEALDRLEGVSQSKFQKKFLKWLEAYEKLLATPHTLPGGLMYKALTDKELSLFRRLSDDHKKGKDVDFNNAAITACLAASRENTIRIATRIVNRRDPSVNAVVEAARDFKEGLFRDLNFYTAIEWQTAKGETKPMPPSIDTYIHQLSTDKQFLLDKFWNHLRPLTIESDADCGDSAWDYSFKTVAELRDDRKIERDAQKKVAPEEWEWVKCDAPTSAGGYSLDQIRSYAKEMGVKEISRKNTRAANCAVLKWKLLGEYGPELIYLPWNDLMTVIREVGLDSKVWESRARDLADSRSRDIRYKGIVDIEEAKTMILEQAKHAGANSLEKQLKDRLEQKVNEKMDWSAWDWDRCGIAPKKGGYTPQMIKDYASTIGIDLKSVVGQYKADDRSALCGALKWLALKEIDPSVLKVVGDGGKNQIPRTDLLKMAHILGVKTSGISIPLDYSGAVTLRARLHKALK